MYLQLYFYDTENEICNRLITSDKFCEFTLRKLIDVLNKNPYSKFFRSLREVSDLESYCNLLKSNPGVDRRIYNLPTSQQVALVWVDNHPSTNTREPGCYESIEKVNVSVSQALTFIAICCGYGIVDSVQNSENRGYKIGRSLLLPSNFVGGPRNITKRYMDAMSLVQRYGKPDMFLTIRCNPNWPEIKCELKHSDEIQNRPGLLVRIFCAKFEELKADLVKRKLLDPIAAHAYVIEFQKRGLPHAHFLLIFKRNSKIRNYVQVNEIVSSEISDKKNPYLYATILKHMMHGPCRNLNLKNVCMKKNFVCKNKYSRDYVENTSLGNDSYPLCKRRNDGVSVKVRGCMLDNRWVVPYNPYILAKYDCHINVEVCSSVKVVKYLYKYVYKRHGRIHFTLDKETNEQFVDEISNYQTARWISPPEVMWRIFSFDLFDISPTVIFLQLYTKDAQTVTYNETDDLSKVINKDFVHRTMLTEFFKMNISNEKVRVLSHDLLSENSYFEMCLFEAVAYQMPILLRRLFANVLSLSCSTKQMNLRNKFKDFMIEDYLHKGFTQQSAKMEDLHCINSFLESVGKSIIDFYLVDFDLSVNDDDIFETMIAEETTNINFQSDVHYSKSLNKEQQNTYDTILDCVLNDKSGMFFINGPGGTEKTYLYKTLLFGVRSRNLIALETASSGVAASLLSASRTGHSRFKIPLKVSCDMRCSVSKQSALGKRLPLTRLIIWDETSMVHKYTFEALDKM
ncbi:uncharacterized protein LOC111365659 [Olea europaea var. sylvestris]|uniref:uncharacterized protein LOC111365659 n=1 Tax=Olea europaea var. sylvestris TaxID=158386 RepID=UPI000C1CEE1D|nr:uncharacterized protein LOC111365659 [Olea europaea var. sylvestris]